MNFNLSVLSFLFSALLFSYAQAQRVSGGGNVVYCDLGTTSPPKVTLLDYYDSMKPNGYGFEFDLGPGKTADEKIEYVLKRLEKVDPFRANLYRKFAREFEKVADFSQPGFWSTSSNDLGTGYILPPNCSIKRAANLRSEDEIVLTDYDKIFEISKAWDGFDEDTKAGLKLHEIAYREAIFRGAANSLSIRRYVALISSKDILKVNYSEEILKSGLMFWGTPVTLDSSWTNGTLIWSGEFPAASQYVHLDKITTTQHEIIYRNFSNSKTKIKFEDQTLECSVFILRPNNVHSYFRNLLNIYRLLFSQDGLHINQLPDDYIIQFVKCGDLKLNHHMFSNTKFSFDLILDTNKSNYGGTSNDGVMTKKRLWSAPVKSGTISGNDVSGKICYMGVEKGDVSCQ